MAESCCSKCGEPFEAQVGPRPEGRDLRAIARWQRWTIRFLVLQAVLYVEADAGWLDSLPDWLEIPLSWGIVLASIFVTLELMAALGIGIVLRCVSIIFVFLPYTSLLTMLLVLLLAMVRLRSAGVRCGLLGISD